MAQPVEGIGAGEAVTLAAGDNLVVDQAGNDVTFSLASDLTGLNSVTAATMNADTVNVTGGATLSSAGIDMNGDGISGLAAGSTIAGSTEAVNGGQINTALSSVATNLGGGSVYDPVTGTVTSPAIAVGGANYGTVTDAIEAADAKADTLGSGLAAAVGGGASVAPDGTVTAPNVNVNGSNYTNLTDAIEAAGAGFDMTTGATGSGVANGTSVEGIGAGETVTLTAGDNIVTTQNGNEVQVALNSDLTGLNSVTAATLNADMVNVTGGPSLSSTGIAMNGRTTRSPTSLLTPRQQGQPMPSMAVSSTRWAQALRRTLVADQFMIR